MQYTTDDDDLEGPDAGIGEDSGWKQARNLLEPSGLLSAFLETPKTLGVVRQDFPCLVEDAFLT